MEGGQRLIETWDVLKFAYAIASRTAGVWLIETWDVLKSIPIDYHDCISLINRNMRCIEIWPDREAADGSGSD